MTSPATMLRQLAREVGRLRPDWRNPERYFADRSEIEHALRRLANQMEQGRGRVVAPAQSRCGEYARTRDDEGPSDD